MSDTGLEKLSGDVPLTAGQRLRYIAGNAWRNLLAWRGVPSIAFVPRAESLVATQSTASPSRRLTECFLRDVLPVLLPPGEVRVLDIGCGSGFLAQRLAALGYRGHYTGIDIDDRLGREALNELPFSVEFFHGDVHAFAGGPFDLILSISALEHIPDDAAVLARLRTMLARGGLQLHVVPSGWGLFCYLWHGYRQYAPGAIARRFPAGLARVWRLGGLGSFALHVGRITICEMLLRHRRNDDPAAYERRLQAALRLDRSLPVLPTAYAIVERAA